MFDNICKYLAQNYKDDFAQWLFGYPLKLTELKPTELSLEPIIADSLIFLQSEELVLHLEFQTEPDNDIPFRMLDYRVRVYRKFPQKQMRQIVIYLRKTTSELVNQTTFNLEDSNRTTKANLTASSAILAGLVLKPDMIQRILRSDIMRESTMYQEILKEGELRGKLEGKLEGKLDVAINLLRRGMSVEDVINLTDLSEELILNLVRNLNNNN